MIRISREEMLMDMALVVRGRSTCLRRQVGAVLALDGRVLSSGYNGVPSGLPHCTPQTCNETTPCLLTIHAEQNAIAFAARHGVRTSDSTLYSTASPCLECAKLIINAGIRAVYYAEEYRDLRPVEILRSVGIIVQNLRWPERYEPFWRDPREGLGKMTPG